MNLFAEYEPQVRSSLNYQVQLLSANPSHVEGVAKLIAERNEIKLSGLIANLERAFKRAANGKINFHMFVAMDGYSVVGYGKCQWLSASTIEGAYGMDDGWYLMGIIVDPRYRRQGIGRRLCEARIRWIKQHADNAFCYVNALNEVSIRLHKYLGFREISRKFGFPGLAFKGGQGGILYEANLV